MPQVPKAHVRDAIVRAAAEELAAYGYEGATLSRIAAQAGTSIGNLYKYFANKEELLAATVPESLARRAQELLTQRVQALGTQRDVQELTQDHPYRRASEELFSFTLAHRHELVFLLCRAHGTGFESFAEDVAARLSRAALRYATEAYSGLRLSAAQRRALIRIYRAFVGSIAAILDAEVSERALGDAVAQLSTYHLAGLKAFFEAAHREVTP